MPLFIQLLSALCGSFGFALIFGLRGKSVFYATVGGMLTWGLYLLCKPFGGNLFLWNLIAAAFAAAYSEGMARVCKMPSTAFLAPTIIPLVPGGSLYYTLLYLIGKEEDKAGKAGIDTLLVAGGIAVGVVLVSVVVRFVNDRVRQREPKVVKKV